LQEENDTNQIKKIETAISLRTSNSLNLISGSCFKTFRTNLGRNEDLRCENSPFTLFSLIKIFVIIYLKIFLRATSCKLFTSTVFASKAFRILINGTSSTILRNLKRICLESFVKSCPKKTKFVPLFIKCHEISKVCFEL
jgi:hypothetical protein